MCFSIGVESTPGMNEKGQGYGKYILSEEWDIIYIYIYVVIVCCVCLFDMYC